MLTTEAKTVVKLVAKLGTTAPNATYRNLALLAQARNGFEVISYPRNCELLDQNKQLIFEAIGMDTQPAANRLETEIRFFLDRQENRAKLTQFGKPS